MHLRNNGFTLDDRPGLHACMNLGKVIIVIIILSFIKVNANIFISFSVNFRVDGRIREFLGTHYHALVLVTLVGVILAIY